MDTRNSMLYVHSFDCPTNACLLSLADCWRPARALGRRGCRHQLPGSRLANGRSSEQQRAVRISRRRRRQQRRALQILDRFRDLQDSYRRRRGCLGGDLPFAVPLGRAAGPRPAGHGVAQQPRGSHRSEGAHRGGRTGGVCVWSVWLRAHDYCHQRGKQRAFTVYRDIVRKKDSEDLAL